MFIFIIIYVSKKVNANFYYRKGKSEKNMYAIYEKVRNEKGLSDTDVSNGTGISRGTFSHWKNGRNTPSYETLKKIADYIGVSPEYLQTGKEPAFEYYLDPEVAQLAQELFDDRERRMLMDASRNLSKDDLLLAISIVNRMANDGK